MNQPRKRILVRIATLTAAAVLALSTGPAVLAAAAAPGATAAANTQLSGTQLTPVAAQLYTDTETNELILQYNSRDVLVPVVRSGSASTGGQDACFASEEGVLAVAFGDAPTTVLISRDSGKTFIEVQIPGAKNGACYKSIGFVTPKEGWLVVGSGQPWTDMFQPSTNLLYRTHDGGATWEQAATVPCDGIVLGGAFASAEQGWLSFYKNESTEMMLYETGDGGATWRQSTVDVLPDMLDGAIAVSVNAPKRDGGSWHMALSVRRPFGYVAHSTYDFVYTGGVWRWNTPDWQLPADVSAVRLRDWVLELVPDINYNSADGITPADASNLPVVCDTLGFMQRLGQPVQSAGGLDAVVPAEAVARTMEYLYGVAGFDATKMPGYEAKYGGFLHPAEHGHNLRNAGRDRHIKQVQVLTNGDISVSCEVYGVGVDGSVQELGTTTCVLRPGEMDGVPIFMLVRCETSVPA